MKRHNWMYDVQGDFYICFPFKDLAECPGCGLIINDDQLQEVSPAEVPRWAIPATRTPAAPLIGALDWIAAGGEENGINR